MVGDPHDFWGGFGVGEALIVLCSVTRAFFLLGTSEKARPNSVEGCYRTPKAGTHSELKPIQILRSTMLRY